MLGDRQITANFVKYRLTISLIILLFFLVGKMREFFVPILSAVTDNLLFLNLRKNLLDARVNLVYELDTLPTKLQLPVKKSDTNKNEFYSFAVITRSYRQPA